MRTGIVMRMYFTMVPSDENNFVLLNFINKVISTFWYLRNIAPWALLGYLAGCAFYVLL
jgi:hypothetical protein